MPRYTVECEEARIFSWTIDVDALDEIDAEQQVIEMYESGELHMNGADSDESDEGLIITEISEAEVAETSAE